MARNDESIWLRGCKLALFAFNIAFAILALYFILKGGFNPAAKEAPGLDYKDFVSILLTGLSVMIAIGAIFVAILAIWSYNHFKALTVESAQSAAKSAVDEWMGANAPTAIRQHVDSIRDSSLGNTNDDAAADDIGRGAG